MSSYVAAPCPPDDLPGGVYRTSPIGHLDEHLRWMRRNGLADSTLKARRATLTRLAEYLDHDPATATVDELEAWQDSLCSPTSIRHQTHLVRPYFRWLHTRGHRPNDPAALLATPRRPSRLPRPIPETELMTVVSTAPPRLVPWLLLAGWCGLRAAEIAGLTSEQFRTDELGRVWLRVIGKGDRERDVPVPAWLWDRLEPRLPSSGPCWRRERGTGRVTAQHVSQYCSEFLRRSGLPQGITLHSLRHRAATELLEASGGDVRLVQHYLGHAGLSTVHVYTQVRSSTAAALADRLPRPADAPGALPVGRRAGTSGSVAKLSRTELQVHIDEWISRYRSPATRDGYARDAAHWLAWCDGQRLDPLHARRVHVDLYRQWLEAPERRGGRARYAPASVARKLAVLSSLYHHLISADVLDHNPAHGARKPRQSETAQVGMTAEQARAFLETAHGVGALEYALAWLMLSTALRASEVCALDLRHVGEQRGVTVIDVTRKGGKQQRLVVPEPAAAALRAWLAVRPKSPSSAVFLSEGLRICRKRIHTLVTRVAQAAGTGQRVTPHSLRHTAATLALDAGVPIRDVQQLMGHASSPGTIT